MSKPLSIGDFCIPEGYNSAMLPHRRIDRCQIVGVEETASGHLAIVLNHATGEYLALWPVWLRPLGGQDDAVDIQERISIYSQGQHARPPKEMGQGR